MATGDRYVEALCRSGRAMPGVMAGHVIGDERARTAELFEQLGVLGTPPVLSLLAV